jgi:hypothetical protein
LHDQFRNPVIPKSVDSNLELYQVAHARILKWFELRGVLEILLLVGAFPDLHGRTASGFGFWVGLRNLPGKAIACGLGR